MKVKTGLLVIFATILFLVAGSLYVNDQIVKNDSAISAAEIRRYESYKLADELRQSSDDLTRMARTYAVTGNPRYKDYFNQILLIRDGEMPRPVHYGEIFWDYVTATGIPPRPSDEAIALTTLMRRMLFTEEEFALLRQAKENSDELVALEEKAMNAVEGLFTDRNGEYVVKKEPDLALARELLHGDQYHRAKAEIMRPLEEFFHRVNDRTEAEVSRLRIRGMKLSKVSFTFLMTVTSLVLVSFLLALRQSFDQLPIKDIEDEIPPSERISGRSFRFSEIWNAWPLVMVGIVLSVMVLSGSWWIQTQFERQVRGDLGKALKTVLGSTEKAARTWFSNREEDLYILSIQPGTIRFFRELSSLRNVPEELTGSRIQSDLRQAFASILENEDFAGFMLLGIDGFVLGSSHEKEIGTMAGSEFPSGFFNEIVSGVRPIVIALPHKESREGTNENIFKTSLLFGTLVFDEQGNPLGALVLYTDLEKDFSGILQRGHLGDSGESYAFNRSGQLVSESRYGAQFHELGLIEKGKSGILNIDIRDPGGNVIDGYKPLVPREQQPLTLMAQEAVSGRSGINLKGYNDYRGIPVIGTWVWNETLGLGIATEINVDEAYASLRDFEKLNRIGTVSFVALLLCATLFVIWSRSRLMAASEAMRRANGRLTRSERRFKSIVELAENAIIVIDTRSKVKQWNQGAIKMFGYSGDEILDQPLYSILPEVYRDQHAEALETVTGRNLDQFSNRFLETKGLHKNGHEFPIELSISAWEAEGQRFYSGIIRDLTEYKRAEQQIRKLSMAVEESPVSIMIADPQGVIEYVNNKFSETTGYAAEEAVGQDSAILNSDHVDQKIYQEMMESITVGMNWSGQLLNRKKSGEDFWVRTSISSIKDAEGCISHYLGFDEDITSQKFVQDQRDQAYKIIRGSIQYASRIQRSILPSRQLLNALLPDHFVIWKPRDVVGGDFYWCNSWDKGTLVLLADCTGHGVPGAFVTLIAHGALQQALSVARHGDVGVVIGVMHEIIQLVLGQDSSEGDSDDGLELGICYIPADGKELTYAGARFSLFYQDSDGKVHEVKGDKKGIGYRGIPRESVFTNHSVDCKEGRRFFMTTDGLIDQIGGERRRGFGKKRFINLLYESRVLPIQEIGGELSSAFEDYQGREIRRDDVSIIGFTVPNS